METGNLGRDSQSIDSLYDLFVKRFGPEVKAREGNNIRQMCPECLHKSLSCNIQTGLIYCFHCSYGKGLKFDGVASGYVEAVTNPKLHLAVALKILDLCTLSNDHREYLAKRGISKPEDYSIVSVPFRIDKLLLKYFTPHELIASGFFYDGGVSLGMSKALSPRRILIPFWSGDEIIGIKSRLGPNQTEEESGKRYICPKGSSVRGKIWYKNPLLPDLIITEGELAAIAVQELGYSGLGIPGIALISDSTFQEALKNLCLSSNVQRVFIVLDSDPGISRDIEKLKHAYALNILLPNSCISYLPQDNIEEKMDIDLYLSRYPLSDFTNILEDNWCKRQKLKIGLGNRIRGLRDGFKEKS